MEKQNYQNHIKYYPPHHFVLLPLLGVAFGVGLWKSWSSNGALVWILFSICIFFLLYIALMLRQHYALGNQNRIVRLEFRLRYYQLFGHSSQVVERQLSFAQIAALRFANDEEFKSLLNRAINENLSADAIKKSIHDWQGDYFRV